VSLLPLVGAAGGDDADLLAPFRECDMVQMSSQWTEQMEAPFPVVSPCVFLDQPLGVGKAREDIKEVEAMPSHIALPLRFIPFIPHDLMYAHIVSTCQVRVIVMISQFNFRLSLQRPLYLTSLPTPDTLSPHTIRITRRRLEM
jgi:hypothetical protein